MTRWSRTLLFCLEQIFASNNAKMMHSQSFVSAVGQEGARTFVPAIKAHFDGYKSKPLPFYHPPSHPVLFLPLSGGYSFRFRSENGGKFRMSRHENWNA